MVIAEVKTLEDALAVIGELIGRLQVLEQENAWLKRQIFESRSEKSLPVPDGAELGAPMK